MKKIILSTLSLCMLTSAFNVEAKSSFLTKEGSAQWSSSLPEKHEGHHSEHQRYTLSFGLNILPLKVRFGTSDSVNINNTIKKKLDFDFNSNVNMGFVLGGKCKVGKNMSITFPLLGLNLGSITADQFSTNGYLKSKTNLACLSPYTGIMFGASRMKIGVFAGIDYIAGDAGYNWDYRNQIWMGLGIGYSIYNLKPNAHKH